MGGEIKEVNFDFASSNYLWRATLDTIDFMPLVSANYSGGIVITDWYSENNNENESIKITIRFLSNEIRSDAIKYSSFLKNVLPQFKLCKINQNQGKIKKELRVSILKKQLFIKKNQIDKNTKENPYIMTLI